MKRLLLFDMDNVLLHPEGYRRALKDTVKGLSATLGYEPIDLQDEQIEEIEACGVTSEWEMSAIIGARLLLDTDRRAGHHPSLPDQLPLDPPIEDGTPPPDVLGIFREISSRSASTSALDCASATLLDQTPDASPSTAKAARDLLDHARTPRTVTFRTIQELVLGSEAYERTYQLPATLGIDSYLERYDQSHLDVATRARLTAWLGTEGHGAAIFTNRPNAPPVGHEDTPEAEIGADLVGLGQLPIVGSGDMGWLAAHEKERMYAFLKPSPVHGLAALQCALGREKESALRSALRISRGGATDLDSWAELAGAQVILFEDSDRGMSSLLAAQSLLASAGLPFHLALKGIARNEVKRQALATIGSEVFPSLNEALLTVLTATP